MKKFNTILLISCTLVFFHCNKELEYSYTPQYQEDYLIYNEVEENDTIMLLVQGGPSDELVPEEYISDLIYFFPYTLAVVHQTQTKDPSILNQYYLTDEGAKEINDESTEILNNTIEHFKKEGKHVIVFGGSFGSFLGFRTIERYGFTADHYALMLGRVDMDQEFVSIFRNRRWGIYNLGEIIEGEQYIADDSAWASQKLMADVGSPQYSQLLKGKDLSKLIYLHRFSDESVGKTKEAEIEFLVAHGATVFGSPGYHNFDETEYQQVLQFVRK